MSRALPHPPSHWPAPFKPGPHPLRHARPPANPQASVSATLSLLGLPSPAASLGFVGCRPSLSLSRLRPSADLCDCCRPQGLRPDISTSRRLLFPESATFSSRLFPSPPRPAPLPSPLIPHLATRRWPPPLYHLRPAGPSPFPAAKRLQPPASSLAAVPSVSVPVSYSTILPSTRTRFFADPLLSPHSLSVML